jgi:predicted nucleotide-binding protein
MAPINAELLLKIQKKLSVSPARAYALVAKKANATYLPRRLAALALAADHGINISKNGYATEEERARIRAATSGSSAPSHQSPVQAPAPRGRPVSRPAARARQNNTVMVVHGRNKAVRDSMYAFLRALGLNPLEFGHGIKATRKGSPGVGEVLDKLFQRAAAVVVVLTPDDEARLKTKFRKPSDAAYERQLTGQARPNVLFEAGRAFGSHPKHTILVKVGSHRPMSDLEGVHFVKLGDDATSRNDLATRLETAGCDVNKVGDDWLNVGTFDTGD